MPQATRTSSIESVAILQLAAHTRLHTIAPLHLARTMGEGMGTRIESVSQWRRCEKWGAGRTESNGCTRRNWDWRVGWTEVAFTSPPAARRTSARNGAVQCTHVRR